MNGKCHPEMYWLKVIAARQRLFSGILCSLLFTSIATPAGASEDPGLTFYESKIRPIFADNCYKCHSSETKQRGDLVLDVAEGWRVGGDSGPALVAHQPESSLIIDVIEHGVDLKMPPSKKLSSEQIKLIREWIKMGAPAPESPAVLTHKKHEQAISEGRKHWAYRELSIAMPGDPAIHPVDYFVRKKLAAKGLLPSTQIDFETFAQRASMVLTGLPMKADEVKSYAKQEHPKKQLIKDLIDSPHYGEHWARKWLVMVRYADIDHLPRDLQTPDKDRRINAYRYRDWVIDALNQDMSYQRFVRLQLGADLMESSPEDKAALGFLGLSPTLWKDPKFSVDVVKAKLADDIEERVDMVSRTLMATTVACARCHNHKYDPVSQNDYYAMAGMIANLRLVDVKVGSDKQGRDLIAYGITNKNVSVRPKNPNDIYSNNIIEYDDNLGDLPIHIRGNALKTGDKVPQEFLSLLRREGSPRFKAWTARLEFVDALFDEGRALAARVIVNRVWSAIFDRGLSENLSDFGLTSPQPSHPELLDYLSAEFIRNGYSLKWLIGFIVSSDTFAQSSQFNQKQHDIDPGNRYLWRFKPRKKNLDEWRDSVLFVSGRLDRTVGGPRFDPKKLSGRRTIYAEVNRYVLDPMLNAFSFPRPTAHREQVDTYFSPIQELMGFNSDFVLAEAKRLAGNAIRHGEQGAVSQIYQSVLNRQPRREEIAAIKQMFAESDLGLDKRLELLAHSVLSGSEFSFVR